MKKFRLFDDFNLAKKRKGDDVDLPLTVSAGRGRMCGLGFVDNCSG
jgi:hypothetical protein